MIISSLKSIYKKINNKIVHSVGEEKMPYRVQIEYLEKFSDPKDDFERSYFKYKCFCRYCYYKRKWILFIYNFGAMFLLPVVYAKLKNRRKENSLIEKVDAVIENIPRLRNEDVIPVELLEKYHKIKEIENIDYSELFLSEDAEHIYKEVKKRYFFHFYYRMIIMQKLGQFTKYLECYHPKAVVFYSCEREFSGPLQALLCEKYGAEYISFMHGDYLSTLSLAFQRYSVYYIWDESYKIMFEKLKCVSPMIVYRPSKLKGIATLIDEKDCTYFATYYFSDETKAEAAIINKVFRKFESQGLRTKVRPHPRFSDMEMIRATFKDVEIENPQKCNLADSISQSLYIIGLNTTVLSEAFFSGKKVVVDDLSNKEKYELLEERGYITMKRPHLLLSVLKDEVYKEYDDRYAFYRKL